MYALMKKDAYYVDRKDTEFSVLFSPFLFLFPFFTVVLFVNVPLPPFFIFSLMFNHHTTTYFPILSLCLSSSFITRGGRDETGVDDDDDRTDGRGEVTRKEGVLEWMEMDGQKGG